MTANHRWSFNIVCPGCSARGVINVVEDGRPPFKDDPRRAYTSPEDRFRIADGDPLALQCGGCDAIFPNPH